MKFILLWIAKVGAVFWLVSFVATVVDSILTGSFLISDDPYIIGCAVGILFLPAVILYLLVEKFSKKVFLKYLAYFLCLLIELGYLLQSVFHGELHGPTIALLLILFLTVLSIPILILMKYLRRLPVLITLWSMGFAYVLSLSYVLFVVMSSQ